MFVIKVKKINYIIFLVIAVMTLAACSQPQVKTVETEPSLPPGKIFFFSKTCPHCTLVEQYITENNIRQKIYFVARDITSDQEAYRLMPVVGRRCGLMENNLGVPLFWDGEKCYLGKDKIINYFSTLP